MSTDLSLCACVLHYASSACGVSWPYILHFFARNECMYNINLILHCPFLHGTSAFRCWMVFSINCTNARAPGHTQQVIPSQTFDFRTLMFISVLLIAAACWFDTLISKPSLITSPLSLVLACDVRHHSPILQNVPVQARSAAQLLLYIL